MQKTKRITASDLLRFIRNLNVKHNVDNGQAGSVFMEYTRIPGRNGPVYRASINSTAGNIHLTGIGSAREIIDELRLKDWRRVLAVAKATNLPPNRREPAKGVL